jgi:hypothetical protein
MKLLNNGKIFSFVCLYYFTINNFVIHSMNVQYLILRLICDYILSTYFSHKKIDFPSYKNNYIIMDK